MKLNVNILCLIVFSILYMSCKREDLYKDFVKDGTKLYPGKPLGLKALAGKNRVKLTWTSVDAKVKKFVIYWNNRQDSLLVPSKNTGSTTDTLNVIIENLAESDYLFNVLSFDDKGNRSIIEEAQANVYGETYIQTLLNRGLKSANSMNDEAKLIWSRASQTETGVEIRYTDRTGSDKKIFMSRNDTLTTLPNFRNGTRFSYRTLYLPDSGAIDTVAAATLTPAAPIITYPLLDKSKFAVKNLPTDQPSAWGWHMPMLWDNSTDEGRGYHTPDAPFPYHFTIDLGVTTALHEMKIWQRQSQFYIGANPRFFEVWGSTSPAEDGSYEGWTKLLVCESIKPSGQVSGNTAADEAYARAGESFIFPDNTAPVRYIRFKMFDNWEAKNPGAIHIMEVNFWSN